MINVPYLYDNASSRTGAFDGRPGSVQPLSQSYDYDGLHRLDEAIRGAWNHNLASPTVTQNRDSQDWSLDPLGNWLQVATDLDGTGGFDADETETRDFRDPSTNTNRVNELFGRTLAVDAGGDELALTYDFAGNILRQELTDDGTDTTALRYTHDAWNRLVKVQFEDEEEDLHPRGEYEYNGLNWRTIRRADTTPADATHALDQKRLMYYGPEWQLLEERIDDAYPSSPGINRHTQYVWGVRYIDDSVASRQDYDPSAEDGSELVTFHLTDAQFSTVAVIGTDASVLERVAYTAYGVARHQWRADITGDGAVDGADLGILFGAYGATIDDAGYLSEADLNLDGIINGMDTGILLGGYQSALAPGVLSSPLVDNQVGFDGYLLAAETQMYIARNRWYLPPLGRWGQRDPIEFVDGMSLYEFLQSSPQSRFDPLGTTTARELLLSYLLEAIQAGVHFDLVPPPRIPVAPGLFLRVTIELKGQASRCCNPETRQIEWWGDVKLGVEISAEAGTTVGRQPKEEPVKGRDRNQRVPHPCVPGETVKKKNYHKTLRECIEKQRSGSGGIGGFVRAKSCGKEGIGFEGYIFVRGSAGVGVGIEFEIEYEIHPDDPLSLDHVNFSGGVGWVGYGASIQFGGGGRGFYKGPIPMLN